MGKEFSQKPRDGQEGDWFEADEWNFMYGRVDSRELAPEVDPNKIGCGCLPLIGLAAFKLGELFVSEVRKTLVRACNPNR